MDSIWTVWRVSEWLRELGTSQVSRFVILCLFVIDTLDLDLYRFNLDSSGSTARSIDLQATPRRVSVWLRSAGTLQVSPFDVLRLVDIYRCGF